MRGPRRKPKELEAIQGNPGRRGKNRKPPALVPVDPVATEREGPSLVAPSWLSVDQRAIWKQVAPSVQRRSLLQPPDAVAFGRYCQWLARYVRLEAATRKADVVKTTTSKHVDMDRLDKSFQALLMIDKRCEAYEDRFGMNPRERLAILAKLAGDSPMRVKEAAADRGADSAGAAPVASPVGILGRRSLN